MVTDPSVPLDRRTVVAELMAARGDALVVSGLGSPTYDVHAAGDDPGNYYLWGAMGGAALIGMGLAFAQPERDVIVVTGDGEQLMALGGLATIATAAPPNLDIYVIDNEHYGETGMQPSHTAAGIDLAAVATACGFADARVVTDAEELAGLIAVRSVRSVRSVPSGNGPRLAVIKVGDDAPPRSMPSRDAVFIKNRFRAYLGLPVN